MSNDTEKYTIKTYIGSTGYTEYIRDFEEVVEAVFSDPTSTMAFKNGLAIYDWSTRNWTESRLDRKERSILKKYKRDHA